MDVLSDLLGRARAQGAVFARSRLRDDWGLALPEGPEVAGLVIHVVIAGEATVCVGGDPRARLLPGDVVLVKPGVAHELLARPGAPVRSLAELQVHRVPGTDEFDVPGVGPATELICGAYRLDVEICSSLLAHLPEVVHLRNADGRADDELRTVVRLLADEIRFDRRGRSTVLDRLLDVALVLCLRAWFERSDQAPPWYAATADREVGRALELMHERPAHRWTVALLAREVGVSRATLARRFHELVGMPPSTYLTEWRMQLAAQQLRDADAPLRTIARSVGYESEFAFGAAFRRRFGIAPGRYRSTGTAAATVTSSGRPA